jgi:hypothetical protein
MKRIGLMVLIVALAGFAVACSQAESLEDTLALGDGGFSVVRVPVSMVSAKNIVIEEVFYTVGRLQLPHGDIASSTAVTVTPVETFKIETQLTADQVRLLETSPQTVIQVRTSSADHGLLNATIDSSEVPRKLKNGLTPVILSLQPTGRTLLDGEYAEVIFRTDVRVVNAIPLKSVKRLGQETFLFTVDDGVAVRVPVRLGKSSGDWIEIFEETSSTIRESKWVLRGVESLQDGTPVRVVE